MTAPDNDSTRVSVAIYKPLIEIVQRVVCNHYEIPVSVSQKHVRTGEAIRARQRIHYLCHELIPGCPLHVIGLVTGNGRSWDHSSICHSYSTIKKQIEFKNRKGDLVYPDLALEISNLKWMCVSAFYENKRPTTSICEHCNKHIIILE